MLDLNSRRASRKMRPQCIDFKIVAAAALARAPTLVPTWLPRGKRAGNEWVALNPKRADGHLGSFAVNLTTGMWSDFAMAEVAGRDLISLKAFLLDVGQLEAARRLAEEIGL